jgi:hypothetical protein
MEDENPLEAKETLEGILEHATAWVRYLSLSTAIIAVLAAVATLKSGDYANEALLKKNDAILVQGKANDQWNYYEAKGIKLNVDEGFNAQNPTAALGGEITKYKSQQVEIQKQAKDLEQQALDLNHESQVLLDRHQHLAISVTLFQVAIALSAIAALMRKKWLWALSLVGASGGMVYLLMGLH